MGKVKISESDMAYVQMCAFEREGYLVLLKEFGVMRNDPNLSICNVRYAEILEKYREAHTKYRLAIAAICDLYPEIPSSASLIFDYHDYTVRWSD